MPLFAEVALAAAPADLSGTWVLDRAASDAVDDLLAAYGASWLERQAARAMTVTQRISQTESTITVALESAIRDRTETLPLDGTPQAGTTTKGEPRVSRTGWEDGALVTTTVVTTTAGPVTLVVRRTLEDGGATMRQRLDLTGATGEHYVADRVFRRQP